MDCSSDPLVQHHDFSPVQGDSHAIPVDCILQIFILFLRFSNPLIAALVHKAMRSDRSSYTQILCDCMYILFPGRLQGSRIICLAMF